MSRHNIVFATDIRDDDRELIRISTLPIDKIEGTEPGEERPVNSGDNFIDYSVIAWRLRGLTGQVLTAVDAALPEGTQNKATKDIIRSAIMDEFAYFSGLLFDQDELNRQGEEAAERGELEEVSYEDVLGG